MLAKTERKQKTGDEMVIPVWRGDKPKHRVRLVYQQYGDNLASALRTSWPQIDAILMRLAALLYSDLPVGFEEKTSIFDRCVEIVFDRFQTHGTNRKFQTEIVFGVTEQVLALLDYTVCYVGKQHILKRWEPLEVTIYELASAYPIERLTLLDLPHPMRGHRDAATILASRVFSMRDMLAAGMLQAS